MGFCPYCNSDAPLLYKCPVCFYDDNLFHWLRLDKGNDWVIIWDRFLQQICDHSWKWVTIAGTDREPTEYVEICSRCGMENPGSFVE